jgi:hypothetical protein
MCTKGEAKKNTFDGVTPSLNQVSCASEQFDIISHRPDEKAGMRAFWTRDAEREYGGPTLAPPRLPNRGCSHTQPTQKIPSLNKFFDQQILLDSFASGRRLCSGQKSFKAKRSSSCPSTRARRTLVARENKPSDRCRGFPNTKQRL